MREISSGTLTVDSLKVAILAALHIADEYHQTKRQMLNKLMLNWLREVLNAPICLTEY